MLGWIIQLKRKDKIIYPAKKHTLMITIKLRKISKKNEHIAACPL
jgi:hypothetical protein